MNIHFFEYILVDNGIKEYIYNKVQLNLEKLVKNIFDYKQEILKPSGKSSRPLWSTSGTIKSSTSPCPCRLMPIGAPSRERLFKKQEQRKSERISYKTASR